MSLIPPTSAPASASGRLPKAGWSGPVPPIHQQALPLAPITSSPRSNLALSPPTPYHPQTAEIALSSELTSAPYPKASPQSSDSKPAHYKKVSASSDVQASHPLNIPIAT